MRTRSAKKLAQRIDLYYFKHASPLRRWRMILSIAAPVVGLLWLGGMAAAGSRAAFSSGPVALAHAFAESKCEVCHVRAAGFRAHVSDNACVTCHDAPAHANGKLAAPSCATCHREHQGRVALARTADDFCVRCHGDLTKPPAPLPPDRIHVALREVRSFPAGHPSFARDPGEQRPLLASLKFSHQIHLKKDLRGPNGPERLECAGCHTPQSKRTSAHGRSSAPAMSSFTYERQCARCHPLFFDERLDVQAPHKQMSEVVVFIEQALREYIAAHPAEASKPDPAPRRVPLNFTPAIESPPRTGNEWVNRHLVRAENVLWDRTCRECHATFGMRDGPRYSGPYVVMEPVASWMPRAAFDHRPHLMLECRACHDAEKSTAITAALMPAKEACATCHAPGKGAESRCFECHAYHDWSQEHPVAPGYRATDFH